MKNIMFVCLTFCIALSFIDAAGPQSGRKKIKKSTASKIAQVSFKNQVFPVISKYCLPCHTEDQMNPSELYMGSYESLMAGGKHGKPVIAGKADSSLVMLKLSPTPPFGDRMPLKAKILPTEAEIKLIKDWINQGARQN